ncbi:MAG TPA: glycosyltransferase family 39 protein [Candidatus Paceibacterota bacterium]
MHKSKAGLTALICILLTASFLRLVFISRGDTINDEVLYAFRAIGMLDFDEAAEQTTPLEWWDTKASGGKYEIPWWTRLSFHDHPPLVFLIQHFFMRIFGEHAWAFRLPSALFGIASVLLLYLIGKELYSKNTGLVAAGLLAITVNHVYISRVGLQESYVLFFILLASYLFLRAQKNDTCYLWTGTALGLGFLTKYNTFILVPIFLTYLLLCNRSAFRNKKFWLGALFALVIFTPVIVYNIELYRAVGHFDFQFSFIFRQYPKVWGVTPGKEIGGLSDRIHNFPIHLFETNSWVLLALFLASLVVFFVQTALSLRKTILVRHALFALSIIWLLALFSFIGTSYRFLSMLTPFIVLVASLPLAWLFENRIKTAITVFALIASFEIFYTVNSLITYYPRSSWPVAYSKVRDETYNWGYNALDKFVSQELTGKMPAVAFQQKYEFLERIHETALKDALTAKLPSDAEIIIYDGNVNSLAQLWTLDRWQVYHAWPVVRTESYLEYLEANRIQDIQKDGFGKRYFIIPTDTVPQKRAEKKTEVGTAFARELESQNITPRELKNKRGETAFRIYEF